MKKQDLYFVTGILLLFLPFILIDRLAVFYMQANIQFPMLMAFIKFAILAPIGEVIGLRIKTGHYIQPGFGLMPRAVVWGLIGLTIQAAFMIFATGAPVFLDFLGMSDASGILASYGFSPEKLLVAFSISVFMNLFYAPVMMTFHKITDTHIEQNGGAIKALFRKLPMGEIMQGINWRVQWNFVFKKTIPLFWIPAHTITFLLPPEHRVLFAALLGIMLGVFLAVAAVLGRKVSAS
ncbi:MAG: Mpv17/PMP22 family protein [Bacteroidales bacterium]